MFSILVQNLRFFEILSSSEPILRAKIENMISPAYVLCYIPRANGNFWEILDFSMKISN